jgi:chitosanase
MRDTQDVFFTEAYWEPAARTANRDGITSTLGVALIYDGFVHGSWKAMRDRTNEKAGTVGESGEHHWLQTYVTTRRAWLAGDPRRDLRPTVYRMDAFQRLIDQGYWNLELPLVVRGKEISLITLSATPPSCYVGPQPGTRALTLESPLLRGLDVRLVQLGLSDRGIDIKADGIFGQTSQRRIREYQATQGLPVTGVADISLIAELTS